MFCAAFKGTKSKYRHKKLPQSSPSSTLPQMLQKMAMKSPTSNSLKDSQPSSFLHTFASQDNEVTKQETLPGTYKHNREFGNPTVSRTAESSSVSDSDPMKQQPAHLDLDSSSDLGEIAIPSLHERLLMRGKEPSGFNDHDDHPPKVYQASLLSMVRSVRSNKVLPQYSSSSTLVQSDSLVSVSTEHKVPTKQVKMAQPPPTPVPPSSPGKRIMEVGLIAGCHSPKKIALSSDDEGRLAELCIVLSDSSDDETTKQLPISERIGNTTLHTSCIDMSHWDVDGFSSRTVEVKSVAKGTRCDPIVL